MARVAVRLRISGLVHGVYFRASMAEVAASNGVTGWVKNLTDGSVEAFLEGDQGAVARVIEWSKRGPPRARVDYVRTDPVNPRNLKGFKIEG